MSIQAQIVELLLELRNKLGLSLLFIAHDLSLVRTLSDRLYVMYLGKIVESGKTAEYYHLPMILTPGHWFNRYLPLIVTCPPIILDGEVPSFSNMPQGL